MRQDGGHHRWPGPGGILWICLTLVRGVPEATGIRTTALAKDCKKRTGALEQRAHGYKEARELPLDESHLFGESFGAAYWASAWMPLETPFRARWQCEHGSRTLPQSASRMTLPFVVVPYASAVTSKLLQLVFATLV